ncbi:hypothetical protein NLJ89_g5847 [Agrocybe chaxingu]|uniref:Uncharacterized protein n=1 Tax=Agrocybe chaxingu TaxID=84603 RepID=A0A9W8JZG1_9AGAR|nr:hypothetical protein NLJ89_g5847 [Agrocybe chaxingu]
MSRALRTPPPTQGSRPAFRDGTRIVLTENLVDTVVSKTQDVYVTYGEYLPARKMIAAGAQGVVRSSKDLGLIPKNTNDTEPPSEHLFLYCLDFEVPINIEIARRAQSVQHIHLSTSQNKAMTPGEVYKTGAVVYVSRDNIPGLPPRGTPVKITRRAPSSMAEKYDPKGTSTLGAMHVYDIQFQQALELPAVRYGTSSYVHPSKFRKL